MATRESDEPAVDEDSGAEDQGVCRKGCHDRREEPPETDQESSEVEHHNRSGPRTETGVGPLSERDDDHAHRQHRGSDCAHDEYSPKIDRQVHPPH